MKNCKTNSRGCIGNFNETIAAQQGTGSKVDDILERLEGMLWEEDGGNSHVRELMEQAKEQVGNEEWEMMAVAAPESRRRGEFHGGLNDWRMIEQLIVQKKIWFITCNPEAGSWPSVALVPAQASLSTQESYFARDNSSFVPEETN